MKIRRTLRQWLCRHRWTPWYDIGTLFHVHYCGKCHKVRLRKP